MKEQSNTINNSIHYLSTKKKPLIEWNRNIQWKTLENYSIKGHLLDTVGALYTQCRSVVRTKDGLTDAVVTDTGVDKRCVLLPKQFKAYINRIMKEAQLENESCSGKEQDSVGGLNSLNEVRFTDDKKCLKY